MTKRGIPFVLILSVVTLGIYGFYWIYVTRKEMIAKGYKIPRFWLVFTPLIGLVGGIVVTDWLAEPRTGVATAGLILAISLSLSLFVILGLRFLFAYCHAVEKATKGDLSYGFNLTMALLMLLFGAGLLWPAIVQYFFNKVASSTKS